MLSPPDSYSASLSSSSISARPHVIFLVHRVSLATQQTQALSNALPTYSVKSFLSSNASTRNPHPVLPDADVLVMTAQILLNLLSHAHIQLSSLSLLVLDEAHNTTKRHPYARIFRDFYHTLPPHAPRPRIFAITATPVKRKSAVRAHINCVRAIAELEATLDAILVTVSPTGQLEVDNRVPKPHEYIVFYHNRHSSTSSAASTAPSTPQSDPFFSPMDDSSDSGARESDLESVVLARLQAYCTAEAIFDFDNYSSSADADARLLSRRDMRIVARMHRALGFTPAAAAAHLLCRDQGLSPNLTINALLADCPPSHIETGGLRDKAVKLLDLLFVEREHERARVRHDSISMSDSNNEGESFRCIVFVKERISALIISLLINTVFHNLGTAALRSRPVVGAQSEKGMRMSRKEMLVAVDEFRRGEFGILVASNVVEEGIDVPACGLVIAFDALLSSTAYVQARGRARRRDAHFVVFIDEHNEEELKAWENAKKGALIMDDTAKGAVVTEEVRRGIREDFFAKTFERERTLFSRTTDARVGEAEAVSLLNRYSSMRARELGNSDIPEPKFIVTCTYDMFTAEVVLDERIGGTKGVCRIPQISEAQAKRLAALDAYERLYKMKEVDEHLLPVPGGVVHMTCSDDLSRLDIC